MEQSRIFSIETVDVKDWRNLPALNWLEKLKQSFEINELGSAGQLLDQYNQALQAEVDLYFESSRCQNTQYKLGEVAVLSGFVSKTNNSAHNLGLIEACLRSEADQSLTKAKFYYDLFLYIQAQLTLDAVQPTTFLSLDQDIQAMQLEQVKKYLQKYQEANQAGDPGAKRYINWAKRLSQTVSDHQIPAINGYSLTSPETLRLAAQQLNPRPQPDSQGYLSHWGRTASQWIFLSQQEKQEDLSEIYLDCGRQAADWLGSNWRADLALAQATNH